MATTDRMVSSERPKPWSNLQGRGQQGCKVAAISGSARRNARAPVPGEGAAVLRQRFSSLGARCRPPLVTSQPLSPMLILVMVA